MTAKERVRQLLINLSELKSAGPRVQKELAKGISMLLAIIFKKSWEMGEVPEDWKGANMVSRFKKAKRRTQGIIDQSA